MSRKLNTVSVEEKYKAIMDLRNGMRNCDVAKKYGVYRKIPFLRGRKTQIRL
jgi:hypothetical protein